MYVYRSREKPMGNKVNYLLVTNHAGYMHNMLAYSGKKAPLIQQPTLSHTTNVVFFITRILESKGHDLYIDRLYTNIPLVYELDKFAISFTHAIIFKKKGCLNK